MRFTLLLIAVFLVSSPVLAQEHPHLLKRAQVLLSRENLSKA